MKHQERIQVRIGEVILLGKGLIVINLRSDHVIEMEDAKEQLEAVLKLSQGQNFVAILDGGVTLDVSDKAMAYIAKYQDKKWLAFAIIVRSLAERLFANYYLMFKKPIRPTKVFTTTRGAEEWLKQFIPIDKPVKYELK